MGEFIAHLHPALVHLPIGFIILAILADWYFRNRDSAFGESMSSFLWFISLLGALAAMITGLILLRTGHYEGKNMFIHLISGYVIALLTLLIFISKWKKKTFFSGSNLVLKGALGIALVVGGHNGGTLTHGDNYLKLPFSNDNKDSDRNYDLIDTLHAYEHIIKPVFEQKCFRCHEPDDARGKLDMTTKEGLLSDTYGDPGIFPGNLKDSEIFKRVVMDTDHKKFMPPSGPVMSYNEKKLLEWWISDGASFDENLREKEIDPATKTFLKDAYGIDLRKKSFYEKVKIDVLPEDVFTNIKDKQFNITNLAANNNFVEVTRIGKSKEITKNELETLLEAKEHITWLDLGATEVTDEATEVIGQLGNLTKLKLQNTKITDAGLENLSGLKNLSSLNLYGTSVTDDGLASLSNLQKLEKLYVWQTQVTDEGIEQHLSSIDKLEVVK